MSYNKDTKIFSDFSIGKINNILEPCFIMVDKPGILSETMPNIYVQVEPNAILDVEEYLIQNRKKYHTIFTFNQNVLNSCSNSRKYIYGTTFIEKEYYQNVDVSKKSFSISSLSGSKLYPNAPGHKLRQTLYHSQERFSTFPITFYRSLVQLPHLADYGKNPFINNKTELFETHQFAIVIENSRQTNYFTEKIMDCLLTKTIPIYWGCPNISEFFDTTGWIIVETESVDEFMKKMEAITDGYYERYSHIVEANFLKAQKYTDLMTNLNNAICSLPKLFYINLEHRKDRNSHILSELEKVDYPLSCVERVEAVYCPENGALGCTESHLKALELAKSMEGDVFIILEDDFSFYEHETFLGNLEYVLKLEMDWKVCLLSSNADIKLPLNERICRILNSQTTSGYIIKKDYIDKLIETFEESRRKFLNGDPKEKAALDILWKHDQLKSFWISFNRKIGFQAASYSDVEGCFVNYGV